ncbi:MAG: DUF3800 domain-containing protein [Ammonifex sp.]|jgi:hypothetical protein|nr:MAG: DUF3800 domain-containing protein [Ammonifex sp.]
MWVFVDESGCLRANQLFVAGAWFTWKPRFWMNHVHALRQKLGFYREMHFHKVSRRSNDPQYEMIQALFALLAQHSKTWYARILHISSSHQIEAWRNLSSVDIYDNLMSIFFDRFGGHYPEEYSVVVLDEKNRPWWDDYIPNGLQGYLNNNVGLRTNTVFRIKTADSSQHDLLQISDVITAGVRQLLVPSENPNKRILAGTLLQAIDRIKTWDGR